MLQKCLLQLEYAAQSKKETVTEKYVRNKVAISNIPKEVDEEHLELYLESCLGTDDWCLELSDGSCIVTFQQDHSLEGLYFTHAQSFSSLYTIST